MLRVGIVGWRGMVGSVLVQRMREERDFDHIEPVFFSASRPGGKGPSIGRDTGQVKDANSIEELKSLPVVISCQGGDYTNVVHPKLRAAGWKGYWIDAASALRMKDDAVIVLDPVNMPVIDSAVGSGIRDYVGGNCTVSLMMMGMDGLFKHDPRRVDDVHDLPGGIRRWRGRHARACRANGPSGGQGSRAARGSCEYGPGNRRNRDGIPSQRRVAKGKFWPRPGREPAAMGRQGHGQWPEPRRMEGAGRGQQDPGPQASGRSRSTASACGSARCAAIPKR